MSVNGMMAKNLRDGENFEIPPVMKNSMDKLLTGDVFSVYNFGAALSVCLMVFCGWLPIEYFIFL